MTKIYRYINALFIFNIGVTFSVFSMEKDSKIEKQNQITIHDTLISEEVLTIFAHSFKQEDKKKRFAEGIKFFKDLKSELGEGSNKKDKDLLSMCCLLDDTHNELLIDAIKFFMKLRCICENFNTILTLEKIGSLLQYREQFNKDYVLNDLTTYDNDKYRKRRPPLLILLHAGANAHCFRGELFDAAVQKNDIELVTIMFKYYKDQKSKREKLEPTFCYVRTVEMAQLFLDNDCFDIYHDRVCHPNGDPNYLWRMIDQEYPLELMQFCVKHGVDPRKLSSWGKYCLLHNFANLPSCAFTDDENDIHNYLKKAEYIITLIPDMVNALNGRNETPLDVAENNLKERQNKKQSSGLDNKRITTDIVILEKLIEIFKEHHRARPDELTH